MPASSLSKVGNPSRLNLITELDFSWLFVWTRWSVFSCQRTDSFNRSKPRRIHHNKMTGGEGVGFVSLSPSREVWSRVTQELPCFDRISIRICTGNLFNRIAICRADYPCNWKEQKTSSTDLICNHCCWWWWLYLPCYYYLRTDTIEYSLLIAWEWWYDMMRWWGETQRIQWSRSQSK